MRTHGAEFPAAAERRRDAGAPLRRRGRRHRTAAFSIPARPRPGLRRLEKMAAAAGGVTNHRMGLYDAILIKNNHITAAGGVRAALEQSRDSPLPIEIEVRTRAELDEALDCRRRSTCCSTTSLPTKPAEWIRDIAGRAKVELSGGIDLDTVRAYAETGADFVSCGAITHSARPWTSISAWNSL